MTHKAGRHVDRIVPHEEIGYNKREIAKKGKQQSMDTMKVKSIAKQPILTFQLHDTTTVAAAGAAACVARVCRIGRW